MWDMLGWAAWALSAAIFAWIIWDFFKINTKFDEAILTSSREGVDELFAEAGAMKD
jgi:hypothetical protein